MILFFTGASFLVNVLAAMAIFAANSILVSLEIGREIDLRNLTRWSFYHGLFQGSWLTVAVIACVVLRRWSGSYRLAVALVILLVIGLTALSRNSSQPLIGIANLYAALFWIVAGIFVLAQCALICRYLVDSKPRLGA